MNKPTRGSNLLDVILTNDRDLLLQCDTIENVNYSDHKLVRITLTVDTSGEVKQTSNLEYPSKIPLYNWRQGDQDQWEEYTSLLDSKDWISETKDLDLNEKIEYLNDIMEEAVSRVFETKDRRRPEKRIIPPSVRKLQTRKLKLSKSIQKTRCPVRIQDLRKEYMEVEDKLKISYERFRYKKELEVIGNLKDNPSAFYKFARTKAIVQSSVGPLRTKEGRCSGEVWFLTLLKTLGLHLCGRALTKRSPLITGQ